MPIPTNNFIFGMLLLALILNNLQWPPHMALLCSQRWENGETHAKLLLLVACFLLLVLCSVLFCSVLLCCVVLFGWWVS